MSAVSPRPNSIDWGALGMLMKADVAPAPPPAKSVAPFDAPVQVPGGHADAGQADQRQHAADDAEVDEEGLVAHRLAERGGRRRAGAQAHQTHDEKGAG